ncbi:MAG: nucleoside 2-deoxyribosyltransferase domain-containing protein [Rubrobacter sp.]
MLVYLAGPLFSEAERSFNESLTRRLEERGFHVFLPQRDGVERDKPPYDAMSPEERRLAMFELDEAKIMEANVFLFVLDGRVPDEGACVELGIAHTHRRLGNVGKLLVGLHTDTRAAFTSSKLNPMVRVPLDRITEDEDSLMEVLEGYRTLRAPSS